MTPLIRLFTLAFILIACTHTAKLGNVTTPSIRSSPTVPKETPPSSVAPKNTSPPCSVTIPNRNTPPGERPSSYHFGNGALWTALWPEGKVVCRQDLVGQILPDGSCAMKWAWWRGVHGKLTIEGRRLDAAAPPLRAFISEGYGDVGFQSTAVIFPTEGCWEVTGKVGQASLTFVTLVVKVAEP